ncbi:uncharacterized protein LOC133713352 [Rosa rugosa]|uniref:uncharacterized protein LOC133713352 n=1 Tax=Rosa rugosa TaxID=74645 RepID=UPI002B415DE1|nr:uncharacterized protein LOC133713352 [Rosa rugosa]
MYDASREKISNQKAPKQIKAISQKLSTLALEEEKQSVSKHFMKKKKKEERRKKKKKEKVSRCACCASYKGKMKKEIHIWVKATKKELRRLYPELEGQWRRQQEVRRKNHLEMLAAYKKRQEEEEKEKEKEEEEDEEEEELEEEQEEEEIEEEELEEGPEEKQKRIEKERDGATETERGGICCFFGKRKGKGHQEFSAFFVRLSIKRNLLLRVSCVVCPLMQQG